MKQHYFIGTYTQGGLHFPHDNIPSSRGIHRAAYDPETGTTDELELAAEAPNPSFLARHPELPLLYTVNECPIENFSGGGLSVYRIENSAALKFRSRFDSMGAAPCHVTVETGGKFLVVSNYRSGNFALFPLDAEGMPEERPSLFQAAGNGPHPERQQGPHAHFTAIDSRTENLFMVDLGTDTVYVRKYDPASRTFSENPEFDLRTAPGSGPRHLVFSPDGDALYVIGELDSTIAVFLRQDDGRFEGPVQTVSTLPPETTGSAGTAAAIVSHPSGQFLYASNRGGGLVSIFERKIDGRLEFRSASETSCEIPRFCCVSADGDHLFVCGQDSGVIETFRIDPVSGRLSATGKTLVLDSPVCLVPAGRPTSAPDG